MKVFLGGTCAESTWRDELIPLLKIDYFNPVVEDWNEEAQEQERQERETCDFCLYVITPMMKGVYSIAEVVDDSNKRPAKTVFCFLESDMFEYNSSEQKVHLEYEHEFDPSQTKSLQEVGKMIVRNGGAWLQSLQEVADYLNKNS
jgi:hypothetical protein